MADKQRYNTTLWTIIIIFLVVSAGGILFLAFYIPQGTGGKGVKIAILDTGINMDGTIAGYRVKNHLDDRVILNKNFATTEYGYEKNFTLVDDSTSQHGTIIALTIAGKRDGIAPEAELIIARCVASNGTASYEALLAAFLWATEEGEADIVNISLGGEILYNDTITEAINQAAIERGVLTVVSAGNSGDELQYSLSTINGPGDALQAITVGAVDYLGISYYSSLGPLKDHRIKPDLLDSGFALNSLGTSFAAPKIAGKAALLLSWCREQGYKSTPGLLKAALMKSADINDDYPEYLGGAGFPSLEEAKNIITAATKINDLPIVTYIIPGKLPYGISKVFQDDLWSFPITIITSQESYFTIESVPDTGESIISIADSYTNNQSGILDCYFDVPSSFTPTTDYEEQITFTNQYEEEFHINVSVEVLEPTVRIGFDVYHSLWTIDHLLGQFIEMRNYLADESIALVEFTHPDNYTDLSGYDALIIPDPNSYGLRFNAADEIEVFSRSFSSITIDAIVDYVNAGNGLFVLTTDEDSSNQTETNQLLEHFNITVTRDSVPAEDNSIDDDFDVEEITNFLSNHPVTEGISSVDYYGSILNITGENAQALAWGYDEESTLKPVIAAYNTSATSTGRVLVSGSNFMLDNWGINNEYEATDNLDFLYNAVSWLTNTTFELQLSSIQSDSNSVVGSSASLKQLGTNSVALFDNLPTTNISFSNLTIEALSINEEKKKRFFSF